MVVAADYCRFFLGFVPRTGRVYPFREAGVYQLPPKAVKMLPCKIFILCRHSETIKRRSEEAGPPREDAGNREISAFTGSFA